MTIFLVNRISLNNKVRFPSLFPFVYLKIFYNLHQDNLRQCLNILQLFIVILLIDTYDVDIYPYMI